jgi:hypothetical protein
MRNPLRKLAMGTALALLEAWVPIAHAVNSPDALPDPASQTVEKKISVRPLDLSCAPTKEELMAAVVHISEGNSGDKGHYSWHVSPRDYIPWQSQSVNNYRSFL